MVKIMVQTYTLKNIKSFEPKHIFECGQCFRWNKEKDESYTGIFKNSVVNVKKEGNDIILTGISEENLKEVCEEYFDFNTNYERLKKQLSSLDNYLANSIEYGSGIRILKQDFWETLISFIISANNNIPRIKIIIERISKKYGKKIVFLRKDYYTFPTPEELAGATVQDLRDLGLGFRDVRVYETVQRTLRGEINLEKIKQENDVILLREELLKIPGVGPKVADCIMLFSLKRFEVFPVDVWVKRVIAELYFRNEEQQPKVIQKFAKEHFGNLAGLAQQYLFYWRREK